MFIQRILFFLCAFVTLTSYAHNVDVYLSAGPNFSDPSQNSHVQISEIVINEYDQNNETQVAPLVGGGLGYTFPGIFHQPINIALSLMGYFIDYDKVEGTEYPFINSGLRDTLDYQYRAESYAAMIESRFIYSKYPFQPFLTLGIGASWNRLFDYEETPSSPDSSAAPVPSGFDTHTQASFAYEAGLGIQHTLFTDVKNQIQWQVLLDYRYMNLGKAELGNFPAQTVDDTLKIDHLHTQAVVFTIQATLNTHRMKGEVNG